MIRSLYRDSQKLYRLGDEQYINRLKRQAERESKNRIEASNQYYTLYNAVYEKFGREEARILAGKDSLF